MGEEEKMDIDSFSVGDLPSIFYVPSFLTSSEQAYFLHQVNSAPVSRWKTLKNRRLQNWGGVVHEKGLIAQSLPPWLTTLTQRISSETGLFPSPINHVLVNEYEPGQGIMPHQDGPLYFPVVAIVSLGSPTVMRFVPHQSMVEAKEEEVPFTPTRQVGEPASDLTDAQNVTNNSIDQRMPKENCGAVEDHEKPWNLPTQTCQQRTSPKDVSVILMPGSLLLFKDSAYQEYLHGIEDCVEHKLDASVVNAQMLMDGDNGKNWSYLNGQESLNSRDSHLSCALQRIGTRISLTCRLVPKVQGRFLKL
ncbi:unnamed protein product [Calypogeia fissa]